MFGSEDIKHLVEEVDQLKGFAEELTAGLEELRKNLAKHLKNVRANEEDAMALDAAVAATKDDRRLRGE